MTIRRPLYYVAVAFAAAILIKQYFGLAAAIAVGAVLAAAALLYRAAEGPAPSQHRLETETNLPQCAAGHDGKGSLDGEPGDGESGDGEPGLGEGNLRIVLLLVVAAYLLSIGNLCWHDARFAADPVLDHLQEETEIIGIVKEPSLYRDAKGRDMVHIETKLRRIGGQAVKGNRKILINVPAETIAPECVNRVGPECVNRTDQKQVAGGPAEDMTAAGISASSVLMKIPPGTVLHCSGNLRAPEEHRNPNCFDYRMYLKTCGIQAILRADTVKREGLTPDPAAESSDPASAASPALRKDPTAAASPALRKDPTAAASTFLQKSPDPAACLFLLRERYLARIEEHAGPETEALLRAILFGSRSRLEDDLQEIFRGNGTAHILAVSGLHVGMLYAAMTSLWNTLSQLLPGVFGLRKGRRFFLCTAVFFIIYTFMAGYAPSVVRAVCMVLLHAYAQMTGRRYDLSSAAFAVGLVSLWKQPYILFQAGFQMSFLAILTLGLIVPYIHQVYSGVFVGSMAIQIGLAPYMACQFNVLSLIAVLINVPVVFLAGILVPAGMAGMILPAGSEIYDCGLASLCTVMVKLNEFCFIDQVTAQTVASPPLWIIASYYTGLLVFASEEGRRLFLRKRKRAILCLAAAVLAVSVAFGAAADDGFRRMDIVFVDVGQGDCMHIRCGKRNYLIDGGGSSDYNVGEKTLQPYLLKNGVRRVDAAFVTHLHTDHYRGICELAKAGMIRHLFVYEGNHLRIGQICEETGLPREAVSYLHSGQRVTLGGDGKEEDSLEVLWPDRKSDSEYLRMLKNEEDENASSLIMRVTVNGVSLMATGDLGEEGEGMILRKYGGKLHTDILKVGHHGSKTSSSEPFLEAVRPAFAVIQVGERNMYGHPTPEVLDRLAEHQIPVWRNDLQGAIGFKISRGRVRRIHTMISNASKNETSRFQWLETGQTRIVLPAKAG